MEKVAFLTENGLIYWREIFIALGIAAAILMALGLSLCKGRRFLPMAAAIVLAAVLSVYLARLIHWYCRFQSYESLRAAMTDLRSGGFSLIGAFAGCLLSCGIVRLLRVSRDLPSLLDAMAPAGALGIAVGRLGDLFTAADRGKILITDAARQQLPLAAQVVNTTSGAVEWRLATFCLQSIYAALLCALLLLMTFLPRRRRMLREHWMRGNTAAMFLVLYAAGQILLDSTRYDALFLRSNGFVSLEQILCAVTLAAVLALYAVRSVKTRGLRPLHVVSWVLALGCLGGAGYMEYFVQRHGDRYVFAYNVMGLCLLAYVLVVWGSYRSCYRSPEVPAAEVPTAAEEKTPVTVE